MDWKGSVFYIIRIKDVSKLEHLMRDKPLSEREVGAQLIGETVAYAESGVCRRKILISYFGEAYTAENCGNCDNCLNPKEKVEAKDNVLKVLKVIKALDQRFGYGLRREYSDWAAHAKYQYVQAQWNS